LTALHDSTPSFPLGWGINRNHCLGSWWGFEISEDNGMWKWNTHTFPSQMEPLSHVVSSETRWQHFTAKWPVDEVKPLPHNECVEDFDSKSSLTFLRTTFSRKQFHFWSGRT
jgi:hypothetical protein